MTDETIKLFRSYKEKEEQRKANMSELLEKDKEFELLVNKNTLEYAYYIWSKLLEFYFEKHTYTNPSAKVSTKGTFYRGKSYSFDEVGEYSETKEFKIQKEKEYKEFIKKHKIHSKKKKEDLEWKMVDHEVIEFIHSRIGEMKLEEYNNISSKADDYNKRNDNKVSILEDKDGNIYYVFFNELKRVLEEDGINVETKTGEYGEKDYFSCVCTRSFIQSLLEHSSELKSDEPVLLTLGLKK